MLLRTLLSSGAKQISDKSAFYEKGMMDMATPLSGYFIEKGKLIGRLKVSLPFRLRGRAIKMEPLTISLVFTAKIMSE